MDKNGNSGLPENREIKESRATVSTAQSIKEQKDLLFPIGASIILLSIFLMKYREKRKKEEEKEKEALNDAVQKLQIENQLYKEENAKLLSQVGGQQKEAVEVSHNSKEAHYSREIEELKDRISAMQGEKRDKEAEIGHLADDFAAKQSEYEKTIEELKKQFSVQGKGMELEIGQLKEELASKQIEFDNLNEDMEFHIEEMKIIINELKEELLKTAPS
ncbi:hypothetical protein NEMIN01_1756 [Nematocida minor]|uniref:uncharacterized protein n=1 Tax=Nematocida minor TaxID=1912983 RepID=UPI0022206DAE|nr:uncharacterized protein NEMIN01_1756 [Nematocida minor]KAI5191972.1 hypothetical protein NEMIN01_1756 [Nematocida minor]